MSDYLSRAEIAALNLQSVGKDVLIHRFANLVLASNLSIGDHSRIDGFTTIVASGAVNVGSYTHIGGQCFIAGAAGFEMSDFSTLSHGCKVFTVSDDYSGASMTNPTVPEEFKRLDKAPVSLGKHVVVGANSVLLPGAVLSEGVAVGALSLVRGVLQPWTIYAGAPARAVKARSQDVLNMEAQFLRNVGRDGAPEDL